MKSILLKLVWAASAALLFSGCDLLQTEITSLKSTNSVSKIGEAYHHKAELVLTLEGSTFQGMAATILKGPVTIGIESKVGLDRLEIHTCSRHEVFRAVDKNWYGGVGKKLTYTYTPNTIELNGMCPMFIQAFSKSAVTSWGFLAFRKDEFLPAKVDCNGVRWTFSGFSVCQSKAGYVQQIQFSSDIKEYEASESCNLKETAKNTYEVTPDLGFCDMVFYDGENWHSSIFLGYGSVLVLGE